MINRELGFKKRRTGGKKMRLGRKEKGLIKKAYRGLRRAGLSASLAKAGSNNVGKAAYQKAKRGSRNGYKKRNSRPMKRRMMRRKRY